VVQLNTTLTFPEPESELMPISTLLVLNSLVQVSHKETTVMDKDPEINSVLRLIGLKQMEIAEEQQRFIWDQDLETMDAQPGDAQTKLIMVEGAPFIWKSVMELMEVWQLFEMDKPLSHPVTALYHRVKTLVLWSLSINPEELFFTLLNGSVGFLIFQVAHQVVEILEAHRSQFPTSWLMEMLFKVQLRQDVEVLHQHQDHHLQHQDIQPQHQNLQSHPVRVQFLVQIIILGIPKWQQLLELKFLFLVHLDQVIQHVQLLVGMLELDNVDYKIVKIQDQLVGWLVLVKKRLVRVKVDLQDGQLL
jgi:hypothetical protein